jgi:hypothetical protein
MSSIDQCIQFTFPQTGGVYGTLNQMQQVQATDHFDTMRFCERFMIDPIGGNFPNTLSFAHTKIMIRQHSAVMRCVIFSEMMALPHNIFQDFRRYCRHVTPIKFHLLNFGFQFYQVDNSDQEGRCVRCQRTHSTAVQVGLDRVIGAVSHFEGVSPTDFHIYQGPQGNLLQLRLNTNNLMSADNGSNEYFIT